MSSLRRQRPRGQALVEFALVLPVIVLLIFGIVDVGRAVFTYNTLSEAARQASRTAIVNQSSGAPEGAAIAYAPTLGLTTSDVQVCYKIAASTQRDCNSLGTQPCSTIVVGCLAIVDVSLPYTPLTPVISNILGTVNLSSTSIQPLEAVCPSTSRTTC
jgi:Flp pilus assembly protein TadG